jgi:hypothetical protein
MNPELQMFIDRVIVPALLERFLREQQAAGLSELSKDLPKAEANP